MTSTDDQSKRSVLIHSQPVATVGAGRLASLIWKDGDEQAGWRYRFNIFRTSATRGRVSQLLSPGDVVHLVKLAHVLAAVIADDGCIAAVERDALRCLAMELDELWDRLSRSKAGYAPDDVATEKGDADGHSARS